MGVDIIITHLLIYSRVCPSAFNSELTFSLVYIVKCFQNVAGKLPMYSTASAIFFKIPGGYIFPECFEIDLLIDWLIELLIEWLIDWLIDWHLTLFTTVLQWYHVAFLVPVRHAAFFPGNWLSFNVDYLSQLMESTQVLMSSSNKQKEWMAEPDSNSRPLNPFTT